MRYFRPVAAPTQAEPTGVRALIFDLDNTLYTHPAYAAFQEEVLIARLGEALGCGKESAAAQIAELRAARRREGQPSTSLGNLCAQLGIDMATSVRWREENIDPAAWLKRDARLNAALRELSSRFELALLSNNPRRVAERSLIALGVRDNFRVITGLDGTYHSKPEPEPFVEVARLMALSVGCCLSVGDRFDVDVAPALALGMSGILVDGVEDVYGLPAFFAAGSPSDVSCVSPPDVGRGHELR